MRRAFWTTENRAIPLLLALGAAFLVFRVCSMQAAGAFERLVPWAVALSYVELVIDACAALALLAWAVKPEARRVSLGLWLTFAVVIVHAVRVLVFALGRTGPWVDFDVRPEFRAVHGETWTWGEVWFASAMVVLSLIVTVVVWTARRGGRGS